MHAAKNNKINDNKKALTLITMIFIEKSLFIYFNL
tara:strand:- start:484 stop:588 length:105 start_codon:yes stop_codon:yes gene_type:complete